MLLLTIGALFCFALNLFAQTPDSQTREEANKSWTATTDLKGKDINPTRIVESHSQDGNLTVEGRSLQGRGFDGNFEVFQDIETETLQVDASTARTTTRMFGRGADGRKTLVQVTEEDKHALPSGDSNVLRITSNPDLNGRLQPVRREIVERRNTGVDGEETNTTVMLPSINGGFAPALKTREVRKRVANDTMESEETTLLTDGADKWQVSKIRRSTVTQEGNNRSIEERVFRRDAEGKLVEASRVVSKESENSYGKKRNVVETYSIDVPGNTQDGSLHLIERKTSTESSGSTAERTTEQQVEQINPGEPGASLRVSALVDGRMVPGSSGEQTTVTIRARDSNGSFGIVSVDTTKSDRIPTIQVQQTPAQKP